MRNSSCFPSAVRLQRRKSSNLRPSQARYAPVRNTTKSKAGQANKTQTQRESIDNTAATKKPREQPAQKSQVRPKMRPIPESTPEAEVSTSTTNETTSVPIPAPAPMPVPSSSLTTTASSSTQAGSSKVS
ncbi:hypothetical protein FRC12_000819 [Ceratobasidium sp. 428]|nr:hypothetical protein FRC12_000819 [Ceratobasidium sp. 428]